MWSVVNDVLPLGHLQLCQWLRLLSIPRYISSIPRVDISTKARGWGSLSNTFIDAHGWGSLSYTFTDAHGWGSLSNTFTDAHGWDIVSNY